VAVSGVLIDYDRAADPARVDAALLVRDFRLFL
jgi:hypothetical protein